MAIPSSACGPFFYVALRPAIATHFMFQISQYTEPVKLKDTWWSRFYSGRRHTSFHAESQPEVTVNGSNTRHKI